MIRAADSRADLERCVEICNAVEPDSPVQLDHFSLDPWAAEHGYTQLLSDMVEGNAPMRALNERLGYRPLPPVVIVSGSSLG
jgi:hypothetical protein